MYILHQTHKRYSDKDRLATSFMINNERERNTKHQREREGGEEKKKKKGTRARGTERQKKRKEIATERKTEWKKYGKKEQ